MAENKVTYGQYEAYAVGNSARFRIQGRPGLIKRAEVPAEIATHLETQLGIQPPETKSNMDKTMEKDIVGAQPQVIQPEFEVPLAAEDFDDGVDLAAAQLQVMQELGVADPDFTTDGIAPEVEPVGIPLGPRLQDASIYELAQVLFEKYGVYTAWLKRYPEDGEISPVTGEIMPMYERGVYYQYAKRILNQNTLDGMDYETIKDRQAFATLQSQDIRAGYSQPQPINQPIQPGSFADRTSVVGMNKQAQMPAAPIIHVTDPVTGKVTAVRGQMPVQPEQPATTSVQSPDGPISQPNFGGQTIRENW